MNQPGRSFCEFGSVQMWNLNWILLAFDISGIESIDILLVTQPLCIGEATTGTAPEVATYGLGALVDIVLGYPPSGAM